MAATAANLRGALAMSADSTDDGAGGAGEILHGAPTPGAAPTIGALRRVALAAGVSNEAADACLETQGPREALLSAIQLQSSTARSELAKRTPEAPPPAPEVYEVSVESELPASKQSYQHRKRIQLTAGRSFARLHQQHDFSMMPIKFRITQQKGLHGCTRTEWNEQDFTLTAIAANWRDALSYRPGKRYFTSPAPPDAKLFGTGCAQSLLPPGELLNQPRKKKSTRDAAGNENDDSVRIRANTLTRISVIVARKTLDYCVGKDIIEPSAGKLTKINSAIKDVMGESGRMLTAIEVKTWVYHEKKIDTAMHAAMKTRLSVYQNLVEHVLRMLEYTGTGCETASKGDVRGTEPNSEFGRAALLLRKIIRGGIGPVTATIEAAEAKAGEGGEEEAAVEQVVEDGEEDEEDNADEQAVVVEDFRLMTEKEVGVLKPLLKPSTKWIMFRLPNGRRERITGMLAAAATITWSDLVNAKVAMNADLKRSHPDGDEVVPSRGSYGGRPKTKFWPSWRQPMRR